MRISDIGSLNGVQQISTEKSVSANQTQEVAKAEPASPQNSMNLGLEKNLDSEERVFDKDMLDKAVVQANKSLKQYNRYIQRSVHEKTKAIMYVMKDAKTDEIIREFPPKKIQDMIAKMWELAGLFVDEKA